MAELVCPKGHTSTESDYCSECGARMEAPLPAAPQAKATEACPECGTPRENHNVVFCDVCGFNFDTGVSGGLGITAPPPVAAAPTPTWSLTLTVDATLQEPGSPAPPAIAPTTFTLTAPVSLIGRKSEARGIYPDIPIQYDDAVSHRHALLQIQPTGTLHLRDVGAANGTRLNGQDVPPLTDVELHTGDVVTLGHWSRITVTQA